MANVHNAKVSEIGTSLVRTEEISMITIKNGPGCWNRPLISGTVETRKYGEIEEGYNYVIAEIQTTTAIVNYIEQ